MTDQTESPVALVRTSEIMNRLFGVLVLIAGIASGIMFFVAGSSLGKASTDMTELKSVGGTSVAEAYYQGAGKQGLAYSTALYACGVGIIAVSLALGGLLLLSDRDTGKTVNRVEDAGGSLPNAS